MVRITEKKEGTKTTIILLEGKITQEYHEELKSEIEKNINKRENVILDFSKVSFLDEEAAKIIQRFGNQKMGFRNCSFYIRTTLGIEEKQAK
jgi:anti-anti-sigma regulatory factor